MPGGGAADTRALGTRATARRSAAHRGHPAPRALARAHLDADEKFAVARAEPIELVLVEFLPAYAKKVSRPPVPLAETRLPRPRSPAALALARASAA